MRARGSEAGSYTELRVAAGSLVPEPFWRRWTGSQEERVGPPRPVPELRLRLFAPGIVGLEVDSPAGHGLHQIAEKEVDDGQFRAVGRLLERGARLCAPIDLLSTRRFASVVVGGDAPADPPRGIPLGDAEGSAAPAPSRPILAALRDLASCLRAQPSISALVWTPPAAADLELPRDPQAPATPQDLFGEGSTVPSELPIARCCSFAMHDRGSGRRWLNLYDDGRALLTSEPDSSRPARVLAEAELGAEEVRRLVGLAGRSGLVGRLPGEDRDGENVVLIELLDGDRYRTGTFVFDATMGELCCSDGAVQRQAIARFLDAFDELITRLRG